MNVTSIGDLAYSLMLSSRSTSLKQTISTLTEELSSGRISDVTERVGGDYSYLVDIDRNLSRLSGFSIATSEASIFMEAAQQNLGRIAEDTVDLSTKILGTTPAYVTSVREHNANTARDKLDAVLASLNGTIAGQSIFGGVNTDRAPLEDADTLLTGLLTAISGQTTATDIRNAATTWFDDPAGFKALMYAGSDTTLAPAQISTGQNVSMPITANDQTFRDLIKNVALTALATDGTLALGASVQNDLMLASAEDMMASQDELSAVRADLGFAQSRVDEATARNEAARSSLEMSRNLLLEADPFETATRLEDAQFQLESLFAVTVRNSRLTLLSFF